MRFPSTIAIIGLGLIGGSMALALKDRATIIAVDKDPETCRAAEASGIESVELPAAVRKADLVVLSTPVGSLPLTGLKMAPHLRPGTIVTDVGSTKSEVVRDLNNHLPSHCLYIGGHPMTGSEKSGFSAARSDLFKGAPYIVTPTGSSHPRAVETLLLVVSALEANPLFLDVEEHDRLVALISHLPYLLSTALARTALNSSQVHPDLVRVASRGFRDMSRLASSDPVMASDFCTTNKDSLFAAMNLFLENLGALSRALQSGDNEFKPLLAEAKLFRDSVALEKGW